MHYQTVFPPEQRRQCLMDDIGTAALAVIGGAGATGAFDYFRQTNEFYYLTSIEVPHACLLIDGKTRSSTPLYKAPKRKRGF